MKSNHLRSGGLRGELRHQRWYSSCLEEINTVLEKEGLAKPINDKGILFRLFSSPFTGAFVALKTKDPRTALVHPLIRLAFVSGLMQGRKNFRLKRDKRRSKG